MEIKSISRLQFRHHNEVFTSATLEEARALAIKYIYNEMWYKQIKEDCDGSDPNGHSLYAEPTIIKYSVEGDEENAHIILAIGAETNDTNRPTNNKFCIIDIDKTEQEIADLEEELAKAIKSLTLAVFDTESLALHVEKTDNGTFLSGDVKTAETHIFDGIVKENNLMIAPFDENNPEGLFIYVDLTYDDANETFIFVVSQADGTLKEQAVKLPNNYLVSGIYKKQDESLHLRMRNGDEIVIDCEELIAEWDVEGDASKTPIVLTREEVEYDPTDEHHHVKPWQDILRGDVRIASGMPNNILEKAENGRSLYVNGDSSKINYKWNGEKTTVEEQLNKFNKICKAYQDSDNIITLNSELGFFASVKLDYNSSQNTLIFTTSKVDGSFSSTTIPLNTVEVIESITYDAANERLVIKYKNDRGETKTVYVPLKDLIDEWTVLNNAHSVKLNKQRNVGGKDILTADVNIATTVQNNILQEKGEGDLHVLYVKGTADNIAYKDTTVSGALDTLREDLDNEISRSIEKDEEHDERIDAVSANTIVSLKKVTSEDNSIIVDTTEASGPQAGKDVDLSVNLSAEVEDNKPNIIKLNADGLYAGVDLSYEETANKLIFKTTNGSKEIQLESVSSIISIEYNPTKEAIVITYMTNGHEIKTVEIPVGDLINEWRVEDGHPHAVQLEKVRIASGTSEQDVLKASVIITDDHADNILVMDDGALYVSNSGITANTAAIEALDERMDIAEGDIDTLQNDLREEISARTLADDALGRRIDQEIEDRIADVDAEQARAEAAELALSNKIDTDILAERNRAVSAETALHTEIETLNTNLTAELNQTATNLSAYTQTSVNEEKLRAMTAEGELRQAIQDETVRANAADAILSGNIQNVSDALDREVTRATTAEENLQHQIDDNKVVFDDTTSIDFSSTPAATGNVISAEVKLQEGDNIIKLGQGLYATAHLDYNAGTNTISLTTSAGGSGTTESFQLSAGAIIDNIYYDDETGELVITYTNAEGTQTVRFNVSKLFNPWIVQNLSEGSAIELIKTPAASQGDPDILNGRVLLTNLDDNAVQIINNGLYVSGNAIESAQTIAACVRDELKVFETAVIGNQISEECGNGYTYHPNQHTNYIISATSFNDADVILDKALKSIEDKVDNASGTSVCVKNEIKVLETAILGSPIVEECGEGYSYQPNPYATYISGATSFADADFKLDQAIKGAKDDISTLSGKTECVDSKANKIYELLNGVGTSMPDCGSGTTYTPDLGSCVISAATSFMEADRMLGDQICEILEMWQSGMTCTSISNWIDDGANKRLEVDVRPSYGNSVAMSNEDLYISNLTGKTIEHGVHEFTDTNALRIVCLTEGGGVIPDIKSGQNGIYLSNVWNCGKYYQQSTEAAEMAEVSNDGYNVNYFTDENSSSANYDYNNTVRQ